jgi:hypothetical protein
VTDKYRQDDKGKGAFTGASGASMIENNEY